MNIEQERALRGWLDARDPGGAPDRLRMAAAGVAYAHRRAMPASLDAAMWRFLGLPVSARLAILGVLLAAVVAVVGAAILRPWDPFPPRGLIAYTVPLEQTGSSGIRLIAADGTGGRQITAATANLYEHRPRWSPDGRTVLFARLANLDPFSSCIGVGSIVLYDVASGSEHVLATDLGTIQDVAWSPSGEQVAFVGPNMGCGQSVDLGVIDLATGTTAHSPLADLRWTIAWSGDSARGVEIPPSEGLPFELPPITLDSPDGRFVAMSTGRGRSADATLTVGDVGTALRVPLGAAAAPTWAPDGTALAFVQISPGPPEYDISFRDRLAITVAGTWQVRTLFDVIVADTASGGIGTVALPTLFWTHDGRNVYWIDLAGGHIVEVETGRAALLPVAVNGCPDLQWQPAGAAD